MAEGFLMKPCKDCPFKPRVFVHLDEVEAEKIVECAMRPTILLICHKTTKHKDLPCVGAELFRDGKEGVFKDAASMIEAHRRSRRPLKWKLWGAAKEV